MLRSRRRSDVESSQAEVPKLTEFIRGATNYLPKRGRDGSHSSKISPPLSQKLERPENSNNAGQPSRGCLDTREDRSNLNADKSGKKFGACSCSKYSSSHGAKGSAIPSSGGIPSTRSPHPAPSSSASNQTPEKFKNTTVAGQDGPTKRRRFVKEETSGEGSCTSSCSEYITIRVAKRSAISSAGISSIGSHIPAPSPSASSQNPEKFKNTTVAGQDGSFSSSKRLLTVKEGKSGKKFAACSRSEYNSIRGAKRSAISSAGISFIGSHGPAPSSETPEKFKNMTVADQDGPSKRRRTEKEELSGKGSCTSSCSEYITVRVAKRSAISSAGISSIGSHIPVRSPSASSQNLEKLKNTTIAGQDGSFGSLKRRRTVKEETSGMGSWASSYSKYIAFGGAEGSSAGISSIGSHIPSPSPSASSQNPEKFKNTTNAGQDGSFGSSKGRPTVKEETSGKKFGACSCCNYSSSYLLKGSTIRSAGGIPSTPSPHPAPSSYASSQKPEKFKNTTVAGQDGPTKRRQFMKEETSGEGSEYITIRVAKRSAISSAGISPVGSHVPAPSGQNPEKFKNTTIAGQDGSFSPPKMRRTVKEETSDEKRCRHPTLTPYFSGRMSTSCKHSSEEPVRYTPPKKCIIGILGKKQAPKRNPNPGYRPSPEDTFATMLEKGGHTPEAYDAACGEWIRRIESSLQKKTAPKSLFERQFIFSNKPIKTTPATTFMQRFSAGAQI